MRLIDTSELAAAPWKNGGGTTRTIAVWPEGAGFEDFIWRVSLADVNHSGGFSLFPGVDRTLMLLEGEGMMLHRDDGSIDVLTKAFQPLSMPGDAPIDAELVGGPSRDFNVMVRRGLARANVHVYHSEPFTTPTNGLSLYFCPRGVYGFGPALLPAGWACLVPDLHADLRVIPKAPDAVLIEVLFELPEK